MNPSTVDPIDADEILLEDFRDFHVAVAREELAASGFAQWQQFVDGRFAAPLESVKLFGRIEFAREGLREALNFVWSRLRQRAARVRLTGRYERSLRIAVISSSTRIAGRRAGFSRQIFTDIDQVPEGAREVQFYSVAPYATKLEPQGGRPALSPRAKTGIFTSTFRQAKGRFGRSVRLRLSYIAARDSAADAGLKLPHLTVRQGGFFS